MQNSTLQLVRWGILATGKIASAMVAESTAVEGTEVIAVASRTQESADRFAAERQIESAYGSYDELLNDPKCDLIYIATPHDSHFHLIRRCLEAGKHVLCEKPLTINAAQARTCAQLAQEKDLFLMEAMWTRFFPVIQQVKKWVDDGAIGSPRHLAADFSFEAKFDREHRLFNPDLAGGALLDLGVYPIGLAVLLFGQPVTVDGSAVIGASGVDEDDKIRLGYGRNLVADLYCGLRATRPVVARIEGTDGHIDIHARFHHPQSAALSSKGQPTEVFNVPINGNGYHYQIAAVSDAVRRGLIQHPLMPLADTIACLDIMDRLRSQWRLRYRDE